MMLINVFHNSVIAVRPPCTGVEYVLWVNKLGPVENECLTVGKTHRLFHSTQLTWVLTHLCILIKCVFKTPGQFGHAIIGKA